MERSYSEKLSSCIKSWFDANEMHYSFDEERGVFKLTVNLKSSIQRCTVYVVTRDDAISANGKISLNVPEAKRPAIAEFITRINYTLIAGNFDLDYSDGEISFRTYLHCCDTVPADDDLRHVIYAPFVIWEKYGDAFLNVVFANMDPQAALQQLKD